MSEQYGLDWNQVDSNAGKYIFPKPRTETRERFLSTPSLSLALKELHGRGKRMKPSRSSLPSEAASRFRDRVAGSPARSKRRRSTGTRGIATAIPLQVDL